MHILRPRVDKPTANASKDYPGPQYMHFFSSIIIWFPTVWESSIMQISIQKYAFGALYKYSYL
jgi:hypothetical protein